MVWYNSSLTINEIRKPIIFNKYKNQLIINSICSLHGFIRVSSVSDPKQEVSFSTMGKSSGYTNLHFLVFDQLEDKEKKRGIGNQLMIAAVTCCNNFKKNKNYKWLESVINKHELNKLLAKCWGISISNAFQKIFKI